MIKIPVTVVFAWSLFVFMLGIFYGQLITFSRVDAECQAAGQSYYASMWLARPIIIQCRETKK